MSRLVKITLLSTYKSYESWTNETNVDLIKPTVGLQLISIRCPLELLRINFT